jgi:hypothetical protein
MDMKALKPVFLTTLLCLPALLLFVTPSFAAGLISIGQGQEKLYKYPQKNSSVLEKLRIGERVKKLDEEPGFYYVETKEGSRGYISAKSGLSTAGNDSREETGEDDLGLLLKTLAGDEERSDDLDEEDVSHSIRGLKVADDGRKGTSPQSAKNSVRTMERVVVTKERLDKFQKNGKVGRYAR